MVTCRILETHMDVMTFFSQNVDPEIISSGITHTIHLHPNLDICSIGVPALRREDKPPSLREICPGLHPRSQPVYIAYRPLLYYLYGAA